MKDIILSKLWVKIIVLLFAFTGITVLFLYMRSNPTKVVNDSLQKFLKEFPAQNGSYAICSTPKVIEILNSNIQDGKNYYPTIEEIRELNTEFNTNFDKQKYPENLWGQFTFTKDNIVNFQKGEKLFDQLYLSSIMIDASSPFGQVKPIYFGLLKVNESNIDLYKENNNCPILLELSFFDGIDQLKWSDIYGSKNNLFKTKGGGRVYIWQKDELVMFPLDISRSNIFSAWNGGLNLNFPNTLGTYTKSGLTKKEVIDLMEANIKEGKLPMETMLEVSDGYKK